MSITKLAAAFAATTVIATGFTSTQLSAQSTTMRQTSPAPRPDQSLVAPEVRDQDMVTCKGIQLYYTVRGIAFTCSDFQKNINLVIVVDDSQFAGGGAAMVPVLDRLAMASRNYIIDPQKAGIDLKVRHRPASAKSVDVWTIMQRRSPNNRDCREAVYFYE